MRDGLLDFEHGITAIDTGFVRPRLDASHLLVRDGRAAFVDTGTGPTRAAQPTSRIRDA